MESRLQAEISTAARPTSQLSPTNTVEYVIDLVNVSKAFRRVTTGKGYGTVKSLFVRCFRGAEQRPRIVTKAVSDLTLRIRRGAAVGIIGRNGAGKSTLLKLISGIYRSDTGSIKVNGRIAALIELGAGFHPDFSGRENIYLSGAMHGLSRREITALLDDIVNFAELQDVIDDPVRTYSSGMFMRLGFSVAIHTDPDIFVVDEVLAVGDAAFVAKSKERIAELRGQGKTMMFVSHDLDAVQRWCDEVIWIDKGKVMDRGEPRRVIDHYREFIERGEAQELQREEEKRAALELESGSHASAVFNSSVFNLSAFNSSASNSSAVNSSETALPSAPGKLNAPITSAANDIAHRRWGSREIEITAVKLFGVHTATDNQLASNARSTTSTTLEKSEKLATSATADQASIQERVFHPGNGALIELTYQVNEAREDVVFGIGIHRVDGLTVYGSNTSIESITVPNLANQGRVLINIEALPLLEGSYRLDIACHAKDGYPYDYRQGVLTFSMRSRSGKIGVADLRCSWQFV